MKNIVITGGLGYIGTELCKLYSGETRFKNITVIDKRFVSERVKQLRDWDINFIQSSILNETDMNKLMSEADVVIHLAGITDVAYVKTQSNKEQDDEIKETGILGTKNIIKSIKPECKFIFPSTHVVYEGFTETKTDISEIFLVELFVMTLELYSYADSPPLLEKIAESIKDGVCYPENQIDLIISDLLDGSGASSNILGIDLFNMVIESGVEKLVQILREEEKIES
jgi:UDP-glucose 4-epimerase